MTDTTTLKPSETLLKAREVILERGHTKGVLEDCRTGEVCAIGALVRANDTHWHSAGRYLAQHLGLHNMYSIPMWNNAAERTVNEVLDALFEAALLAKEDGQ